MPIIDPATLVIVNALMAILLAIIMLAMRSSFPRTINGIDQWALATVLGIIAAAMFSLQESPRFFRIMLANSCMVMAIAYMVLGMLRMFRLRLPPRWQIWSGII